MKILVTGGAGFIGCNLVRLALSRDHEVSVIDDFSTGYEKNIADLDVNLFRGSILDERLLRKAVSRQDAVIHLAALGSVPRSILDPQTTHEVNATGTLQVLNAAMQCGVRQVTVASSSSVYGMNPVLPKSERDWVRPMSPYAVSKLATEQYALCYQQSYDLNTLAFRFFNVYGPFQAAGHAYAAVVPTFVDAMLKREPVWINGDGSYSRDFTYVGTVTQVLLQAAEKSLGSPEPINLAFGTRTSIGELALQLAQMVDVPVDVRNRQVRPGDVPHSQADNASLRRHFADVTPVDLTLGLQETVNWFKGETK